MALTRLYSFLTGSVISNAIITGEFDNIYNNALTLISPLTGDLAAGGNRITGLALGSLASPSLQFTGDVDTGVYSPAADQVAVVVGGAAAATFTTAAAGQHAIGGATNTRYGLLLTGTKTLSGATQEAGFANTQALTNASGVNLYGDYIAPTLTNVAGATATMAFQTIEPSALTITAGSVTSAVGLYITGAPSGATNNYAMVIGGGNIRHAGSDIGFNVDTATGPSIQWSASVFLIKGGTSHTAFWNQGNAAELARLTNAGNLKVGGTAARATTEGTFKVEIFDGTAPVGTLANGISLYSTAGELRVMDSGGTATLLSPHNEQGEWVFDSVDTTTGRHLHVDMERMMKALNAQFGWDFVRESLGA